jgi:putative transposase
MERQVKHTIKGDGSYFLTLTVVGWIDVFTRENHRIVIIDALRYCINNKGLNVYCFCLMSNHLHLIVNANFPHQLSDIMRDFKKFTSKKILQQIQQEPESRSEWLLSQFRFSASTSNKHKSFKFWKAGSHAIELYNERFTWSKVDYIHNNQVEAGLVRNAEDWKYSSASNYQDYTENILEKVTCLSPIFRTI